MENDANQKLSALLVLQQQILLLLKQIYGKIDAEEEWLDTVDMREKLKVSDSTLYRWRKKGLLVPRKIGSRYYYSRKVVSKLIAAM